jgi:hypothetical protein
VQRAELVAVWVAYVCEADAAGRRIAHAWRLFDRLATMDYCHVVKSLHLLRRAALEADSRAVGHTRRFVVDRLADAEAVAVMGIEQARMARCSHVADGFAGAEEAKDGIVKLFGPVDVVGADHDVIEHIVS